MSKKVMLGMSGGVDSSVSAVLLINAGYEVTGVTLKLVAEDSPCYASACASIENAKAVADKLGIRHMCIDLSEKFQEAVIKDFVSAYLNGLTPNPCVRCNKYIKFGAMLEIARNRGFDYIATGHYANIEYDRDKGKFLLKKSLSAKDQSYFLYNLRQEQLSHTIFPIGNAEKGETRLIAEKYNLPTASSPDSQEICFIKGEKYTDFIYRNTGFKSAPGNFVDVNGNKIGEHKGIINYTIGQRKKLGMSFGKPMFVMDIDAKNNKIILAEDSEMGINWVIVRDASFTCIEKLSKRMEVTVKTRYRAQAVPAALEPMGNNFLKLTFKIPHKSVAPGQSAVFYDSDTVVGGGIIAKTIH